MVTSILKTDGLTPPYWLRGKSPTLTRLLLLLVLMLSLPLTAGAWSDLHIGNSISNTWDDKAPSMTVNTSNPDNEFTATLTPTSSDDVYFRIYGKILSGDAYGYLVPENDGDAVDASKKYYASASKTANNSDKSFKISNVTANQPITITALYTHDDGDNNHWYWKLTVTTASSGGDTPTPSAANKQGLYIFGPNYEQTSPTGKFTYKLLKLRDKQYYISLLAGFTGVNHNRHINGTGGDGNPTEAEVNMNGSTFRLAYVSEDGATPVIYGPTASTYEFTGSDLAEGKSRDNETEIGNAQDFGATGTSNVFKIANNGGSYDFIVDVDDNGVPTKWHYVSDPYHLVAYKVGYTDGTTDGYVYSPRNSIGTKTDGNYTVDDGYDDRFFGAIPFKKDEQFTWIYGTMHLYRYTTTSDTEGEYTKRLGINKTSPQKFEYADGVYPTQLNWTQSEYQLYGSRDANGNPLPINVYILGSAVNGEASDDYSTWTTANAIKLDFNEDEGCYKASLPFVKDKAFRFLIDQSTSSTASSLASNIGEDDNEGKTATPGTHVSANGDADTDYHNYGTHNVEATDGYNITFNPESGRYNLRFYIEKAPSIDFSVHNAVYSYTLNSVPSITISPRDSIIDGKESITPAVAVSANSTTRYFVYTLDGSEPNLDGTAEVPATGSSKVMSYVYSDDYKSLPLGVMKTEMNADGGALTLNGVTVKNIPTEDYVTVTLRARAVTNTGTDADPRYVLEDEEDQVEYKFYTEKYSLTIEPGDYTKNIGKDGALDFLGVNAVNIKVTVKQDNSKQEKQDEQGSGSQTRQGKRRKFYSAGSAPIIPNIFSGRTVLYKVKNADGTWGPTMTVLPNSIITKDGQGDPVNVDDGYIRLFEKQNPSSKGSEDLKVWIEGREDLPHSSKDVKYDITYSTSEAGYEEPMKTLSDVLYDGNSPRKDFRVFVKYTGKETTAPDLYVYAQLATTDGTDYYLYPLTTADGVKLEKSEDVKSISSNGGTITDLGEWYVLQLKGYLPAVKNNPGLFNIAVFDQAHKDKKYLFGQNAHNDMFIEYDGTTATDVTPTYTGKTSYIIYYDESGNPSTDGGYSSPMQEVSPTGDDDKFAIINLDSYWTADNAFQLYSNRYIKRTDGVKIYNGENATGDPVANICYGGSGDTEESEDPEGYNLSKESPAEGTTSDTDTRNADFAKAKDLPFHAMYKIPMTLSDGDKFTVKGFADTDPAITYTFRNGGVYVYDGTSDVSAEPVLVYAQHSEDNAQSPDFKPNTISSTDDTDYNLLPYALGDRSSKIDVSGFSTLEYDEEEQLDYYATNGNSDWIKTFDGCDVSSFELEEGKYSVAPNVLKLNNNKADNPLEIPVNGNYMPSTDITVQMLVHPVETPSADVKATLSVSCGDNSKETSVTFGSETKGNVTADGRIDEYSEESANGDWRKLEVTVKGDGASVPAIKVSGDADFYISNVTLLEDANTPGHFYTHAETGVDASSLDLSDRSKVNAFSFFDRGDNKNAIVFVSDRTVLGGAKDDMIIPNEDGQYDKSNQLKPFSATAALYNVAHGDDSKFTIETLKLTDNGSEVTNPYSFGYDKVATVTAKKIEYDREFTAGYKTVCLPFALSSSQLSDLGATAYKLQGFTVDKSKKQANMTFTKVSETVAGEPYIFVVAGSKNSTIALENLDIVGSSQTTRSDYDDTFTGVFKDGTVPYNPLDRSAVPAYWGFASGIFRPAIFEWEGKPKTVVKAFRGYFTIGKTTTGALAKLAPASMKRLVMYFSVDDGTTTGIDDTTLTDKVIDTTAPIYNISGQLVSKNGNRHGLPRGVYIQNNQKFVVR